MTDKEREKQIKEGFELIEKANIKSKEIYIPENLADKIIEGIKNFAKEKNKND